ncbi:RICIN domain-containing protein [Streptomyces sp. NPDC020362]|uniref:RICIN domain-containing protein n=1 Tax=unclassified Streptomyces TaxID=2593676 RepID=UPI000ABCBB8C
MSMTKFTRISAVAAAAVCALALPDSAHAAIITSHLQNVQTDHCMAIPDSSTANGADVIQWTCNHNKDQQWILQGVGGDNGDRVRVRNVHSDKCLAMPDADTANGTRAIQRTCNGGSEQTWIYDSIGRLRNVHSDRCLAVPNGSMTSGTGIVQWTCTTNSDQRWAQS